MEFETYEIILVILAIVATVALIYWALNRGAQAPGDAGDAKGGGSSGHEASAANPEAPAATGEGDSLASASGVARARDAAKSRSGSARRTAKPGASSGRAAGAPAAGQASPSDETSGQLGYDAVPAPETPPAPEPQPVPDPSASDAKPPEPSEAPAAPVVESVEASPSPRRDNLTVIRGIGKSIEKKLNTMGITTFEQIAAWTREDLDRVDAALAFPGRAQRENWVGQAKTLANKK